MDDWRPVATSTALRRRADVLAAARRFFAMRNVLEVETPILGRYPTTDVFIDSLRVEADGAWLRTSPEHHMKRLLAAGSPDIYQIGKVFRAGERGAQHEPEFTLAEWYRRDFDLDAMIAEACSFITELAQTAGCVIGPTQVHDYGTLFRTATGCDSDADIATLQTVAARARGYRAQLAGQLGEDRSAWLDFIASHLVYPTLPGSGLQVVRNYPAAQAMLARLNKNAPHTAERFEVFCNGLELANGFHELGDAEEQRLRFASDNQRRLSNDLPAMPVDEMLLAALAEGLPDCSGVAVGIDRVLLVASSESDISATLSFRAGS